MNVVASTTHTAEARGVELIKVIGHLQSQLHSPNVDEHTDGHGCGHYGTSVSAGGTVAKDIECRLKPFQ